MVVSVTPAWPPSMSVMVVESQPILEKRESVPVLCVRVCVCVCVCGECVVCGCVCECMSIVVRVVCTCTLIKGAVHLISAGPALW